MSAARSAWRRFAWKVQTLALVGPSRRFGPAFDKEWYLARNADLADLGLDPLDHYLLFGRVEGRAPNGRILDGVIPRAPVAQIASDLAREEAVIAASGVFDRHWYAARYRIAHDPIRHYIIEGAYEGCDPNPFFSTTEYYAANRDVARAGANALFHYILFGHKEGRLGALRQRHLSKLTLNESMWQHGIGTDTPAD